ncbi:type IV pilus biogenesis protein PilM [Azotosporobacter soli]|uniref:type IV pilus biogenesis protein PilM n=1 Tax=Azotosporobacter soli TaxID=3055040 RepID=UPI0031FF000C
MNPIKALKTLIKKRNGPLVGIDFGTTAIKVAEVVWRKNKPCLQASGSIEHLFSKDGEEEVLTDRLKQLLLSAGVKGRQAVFSIGGRNHFVRQIAYPPMPLRELKEAIRWDLEKYVPYQADEYYYDFAVLPAKEAVAEQIVLLVAIPRRSVDYMTKIIKNVGLIPFAAEIESLALVRTVLTDENFAVLDLSSKASKLFLYQNGCPVLERSLEAIPKEKRALNPLGKAGEDAVGNLNFAVLIEKLSTEVLRTIEYYRMHNAQALLERVFVCGGAARMENLLEQLSLQLDLPVSLHNPLENVVFSPVLDPRQLQQTAPQLAVAIGLALRGGEGG